MRAGTLLGNESSMFMRVINKLRKFSSFFLPFFLSFLFHSISFSWAINIATVIIFNVSAFKAIDFAVYAFP